MSSPTNTQSLILGLVEAEKEKSCGEQAQQAYAALHKARFEITLQLCRHWVPDGSARVLDIGRSELTSYLGRFYSNVHTLGLDPAMDDGGHRELSDMRSVPHIKFDLLQSHVVAEWPQCGSFDLIVFSEVIEHLCVAPEFVLSALSSLLTEKGVLLCTTPNAADIRKRIKLLLGKNPYEMLRLYSANPGHIREYTRDELIEVAQRVGLRCVHHSYHSWFAGSNPFKAAVSQLFRLFPGFRSFQACVLKKAI